MTLEEIITYEKKVLRCCPEAHVIFMDTRGGIQLTRLTNTGVAQSFKVRQLPLREIGSIDAQETRVTLEDLCIR